MPNKYDQNILTNTGHCNDPVANKVINKTRLGFCQRIISLLIKYLSRKKFILLNIEVWDRKTNRIYKIKDLDI